MAKDLGRILFQVGGAQDIPMQGRRIHARHDAQIQSQCIGRVLGLRGRAAVRKHLRLVTMLGIAFDFLSKVSTIGKPPAIRAREFSW